jgi:GLPGLI family protein
MRWTWQNLFFTNQLLNLLVMATPKSLVILIVCLFTFSFSNRAQDTVKVQRKNIPDITISYSIEVKSNESNKGIGETYNGGVKTLFISDKKARVRLASLMRMQSVFVLPGGDTHGTAVIVKESGKNKYKTYLSGREWKFYNSKYDSAICLFTDDSTTILGYPCRRAIIQLPDNRTVRLYYTDSIRNDFFRFAEPSFHCIPGVVLQYEYTHRKGTISYTATNISTAVIAKDVFKVPVKGYKVKKFSTTAAAGADEAVQVE